MRALIFSLFFITALFQCDAEEWSEFSAVLKPSPISGIGVFATHDIPQGTKILNHLEYREYDLKSLPPELRKYCQFLSEDTALGPERFDRMEVDWFLNHSFDPNVAEVREDYWIAVKEIKAGDELLMDYTQLNEPEHLKEWYYKRAE